MDFSELITKTLKNHNGSLSDKELKKAVVGAVLAANDELDKKSSKKLFQDSLASLIDEGIVKSDDGSVSLIETQLKKRKLYSDDSSSKPANSSTKPKIEELWKNGEQYWRDGTLDQDYLLNNPDKYGFLLYYELFQCYDVWCTLRNYRVLPRITRLFCGNLNRKVTEEDLQACISNITYIKWITDKQTGEFYGTSYLEMKDPASAAAAVAQDKSKFMGR